MSAENEPYPHERVDDAEFQRLVDNVCTRPGMWVDPPDVTTALAFLYGFDIARNGGPLVGFKEWLVVQTDGANNLHWVAHARLALADIDTPTIKSNVDPQLAKLSALFSEFFQYRRANGVTKIFEDYAQWLRQQDWYNGPLGAE